MSFYIRLIEVTDRNRRELEAQEKVQKMLNGELSSEEYKRFLMDLYHIVLHFCPIMAAAASRCPDSFDAVRYHLYHNIDEEKGHEKLVLADLKKFGVEQEAVVKAKPSFPVEAMLAYNYHGCERVHPCSVLGMLYVLEIISSVYGGQVATSIAEGLHMQVEDGGFSFLDSHAAMDLDHMANLRVLLETIEDSAVQDIIIRAIQMNFYLFTDFLKH
jgi:pyrroloquinoline quinone (PQQ) biosynthesis protein C